MQDIDFGNLSLKDALDLAILVEEEAEERYREFVHQMETHNTPNVAVFFRFMAVNEARHGQEIAIRRKKLFGDAPREVERSMIFDVEAPEFYRTRAFMSVQEALDLAKDAETKAYDFFDKALPQIEDSEVRELFTELREEEIEHINLVNKVMEKVETEPDFDPNDFVDEPHGQ